MMTCANCGKKIPANVSYCAYCGAPIVAPKRRGLGGWTWLVLALVVGIAVIFLGIGGVGLGVLLLPRLATLSAQPAAVALANPTLPPAITATVTLTPSPVRTLGSGLVAPPTSTPTLPPSPTFTPVPPSPTPAPTSTLPAAGADWRQGRMTYLLKGDNGNDLMLMDMLSSRSSMLVPGRGAALYVGGSWTRDGSKLAWYDWVGKTYTMRVGGDAKPTVWTGCNTPTWSPDGQRLLCQNSKETFFIIRDAASGDELDQVEHGKMTALLPEWAPDGKDIVFSQRHDTLYDLWRVSMDTGAVIPLTDNGAENYGPAWSPDSQWVAFQSITDRGLAEIWVVGRNGKNARRLTRTTEGWCHAPVWSPDGRWLAYVSDQAGSVGPDYGELFVVPFSGGESRQITHTGGRVYDWRATWTTHLGGGGGGGGAGGGGGGPPPP